MTNTNSRGMWVREAKELLFTRCIDPEGGWLYASDKTGRYPHLFGRDTMISGLLLIEYARITGDMEVLAPVRQSILELVRYQGTQVNDESGEEPGKIPHEVRKNPYTDSVHELPDYVYPNGLVQFYDSVDSTILWLLAVYRYYEITDDKKLLETLRPNVDAALDWLMHADHNNDGLIDYVVPTHRSHFGLVRQNWMDSSRKQDIWPSPVAPVEVQAYAYVTLALWGTHLMSSLLLDRALVLRKRFNETFWIGSGEERYLAGNLLGDGSFDKEVISTMGHCLWAGLLARDPVTLPPCITDDLSAIVKRLTAPDMFTDAAGVQTGSTHSKHYGEKGHYGMQWPHDNAMIYWGFKQFGFTQEASHIARALQNIADTYKNPGMELVFYRDGEFREFLQDIGSGVPANKIQTWALAGMMLVGASESVQSD